MKRATFAGHSLHPMLVVLPLGLFITATVWDVVYLVDRGSFWASFAFWSLIAGLVGGVLAAIPGLIDWTAIPRGTRAKRVGNLHLFLNVIVMGLFGVSLALRWSDGANTPRLGSMLVGWLGLAVGGLSAWLGGELVQRLGIGVDDHPHVNAPSSLESPPAHHSTPTVA